MKVLLFTHGSDIDGMGSIIISKCFFEHVKYYFCEMSNLDSIIQNSIKTKEIYQYALVFVTDLCPSNELLKLVENDKKLDKRFIVIDHHKTSLNMVGDFPFVHITIEDGKGQCCATSLFYEYLVENYQLKKREIIDIYAELTRLEDTWEWRKNNNILAHNLSHLFNVLGRDKYIEGMVSKLKSNKKFFLTDQEILLIDTKLLEIDRAMENYTSCIKDIEYKDKKGALVFIDYQYRNELPEYLKNHHYDYDFAMMVCMNHHSISFRSITDCNVREIAENYEGGGGHDKAAACNLREKEELIYNILLKEISK